MRKTMKSFQSCIIKFMLFATLVLGSVVSSHGQAAVELEKSAYEAYIFSYPMVMMYRSMYLQALEPEKGVGLGNWLHLGISSPEDTTIVTPNNDSPYSYAWVDLRAEPWVLTLPKIEAERFYTSQWDDMQGYVLDNVGSTNDGNGGTHVLLAAPDHKGGAPKGVDRVIKGDSYILGSLTRTQLLGGSQGLPDVKAVQGKYQLQPLSTFLGKKAPSPAPGVDWMAWEEGAERTEAFWAFAGFVSQFLMPHPEDGERWEHLARFGFEPGKKWDVTELDASKRKALEGGQKAAIDHLVDLAGKPFDPKRFFKTREGLGGDIEQLALGVWVGIFGNTKDQSVYYSFQSDSGGMPLNAGKFDYEIRFKKGELPDVKWFWSLTMYRLPERWLVPNKLGRYSIGSASPDMKTNPDGSLTLYLQVESPEKEKAGNWLPAPNGPFWPVLRCYGPGEASIEGRWPEPEIFSIKRGDPGLTP